MVVPLTIPWITHFGSVQRTQMLHCSIVNVTGHMVPMKEGRHHWLGGHADKFLKHNGTVLTLTEVVKHVVSCVTEMELASTHMKAQEVVLIRNPLMESCHE